MGGSLAVIAVTDSSLPIMADSMFEIAPWDSGVFRVNTALEPV
jgi:hypothetical protein